MMLKTIKTRLQSALPLAALLGLFATPALADDAPAGVSVRSFAHAGTGCPADSVTGNFPADGNDFFVVWESFQAQVGNGAPLRDKRKNCQLNLDLAIPAGWQYTVESIDYHGEVQVEAGVQAIAGSAYYFQGDATTVRFNTLFEGPEDRTFTVRDTVGAGDQVWSPCGGGRSLNVNFQVRLDNGTDTGASGLIAFGDADGLAGAHLTLNWRRC